MTVPAAGGSVSAVIPTHDRPQLLLRAIRSVLAQSRPVLEVIVVVDGDAPATVAVLETVGDPRLRYLVQPRSMGPGAARNAGVEAARGQWVAFLDDDDEWLPERIACQQREIAALTEGGDDRILLMTRSRVVTPEGEFIRPAEAYDPRWPIDEWLFDRRSWFRGGQSFIQSSSLLAPRSLLLRCPFPPTRLHEDWEVVLRGVLRHGCRLVMADEAQVIHYMDHDRGSLSKQGKWRQSLDWADGTGDLLSPRAYAGFCLTVVSQGVTRAREWRAFWPLLSAAFRRGRPTAKQLLAYMLLWLVPDRWKRRVRAMLQGERERLRASA